MHKQNLGTARLLDPMRGELPDHLAGIGRRDALVGISFPRYTRLTVETMALAADRGARVVAITDTPLSPVAARAHVVLVARCAGSGFANSNLAALGLINALVAEIAVRNRRRAVGTLARLEKILRAGDVLVFAEGRSKEAP